MTDISTGEDVLTTVVDLRRVPPQARPWPLWSARNSTTTWHSCYVHVPRRLIAREELENTL
jgi:hypothetical protein